MPIEPGNIPPPPRPSAPPLTGGTPDIKIRTMEEDVARATAGREIGEAPPATAFAPDEPLFRPEDIGGMAGPVVDDAAPKSKLFLYAGISVGVLAVLAIGYFVVYPLLTAPEEAVGEPVPIGTATPAVPLSQPATASAFFKTPPAAVASASVSSASAADITAALTREGASTLAHGSLKEVVITANGVRLTSQNILESFLGTASLDNQFDAGAAVLLYYDAAGAWPVYVLSLQSGVAGIAAFQSLRSAESALSINLPRFYISNPGAFGPFRDGTAGVIQTRYAIGSAEGASFNYAAVGNFVILSTSFSGFKAALGVL